MQNLSVERRFLTIALMYGIITAGKEFMRSWIFDFSIATISQRNELDHTFDHLRSWTMWKQYLREHRKAPISDSKASKSLVNQGKNRFRFVRVLEAASSSPATSTIFTVRKDCNTEKSLIIKDFLRFMRRFFNSNSFAEKIAVFEVYRSRTGDFLMYLIFSILSNVNRNSHFCLSSNYRL